MATSYTAGQEIGRGDLDIFLTNSLGNPVNAAEIYFALFYADPGPPAVDVLIGAAQRIPVNPQIGEYYAAIQVPPSATLGTYRIKWYFREHVSQPLTQVVQVFEVVTPETLHVVNYSDGEWAMINRLRLMLRDQNPSKFYHFRPPEHEGSIGQYNKVYGQIWEDAELKEYLERSLDFFNAAPPMTGVNTLDALNSQMPAWRTSILWGAIAHACFALAINWVADEFSVAGPTQVQVFLPDGSAVTLPIADLYSICNED